MEKTDLIRTGLQNEKGEDLYQFKVASGRGFAGKEIPHCQELLNHQLGRPATREELRDFLKKGQLAWLEESVIMALKKLIEYSVIDRGEEIDIIAEMPILLTYEQIKSVKK